MNQAATTILEQQAPRILVVDDDPDIVSTSSSALEAAGYEVWSAESAEAAMQCLSDRGVPHLAIIDINMPGTDGITLSRQIKTTCDLPIVMMTAETDRELSNLGPDDILIYPDLRDLSSSDFPR